MRSGGTLCLLLASAGALQSAAETALPDLGNLSATAILGWYAWHTASRAIPGLVQNFREELAAARAEQRAERQAFREELAAERRQRQSDSQAVIAALDTLFQRRPCLKPQEPRHDAATA